MANAASISGKTVVVTGGSRGIGLALVSQLLQQGNTVIATTTKAPATATHLHALPVPANSHLYVTQLDTASVDSIAAWAQEVKALTQHLDVVINNAGIALASQHLSDAVEADMIAEFKVNALGPFFVTQQLFKASLIGGQDRTLVVQISSLIGSIADTTFPLQGYHGYRASKTALNMLNKLMVQDLAQHNVELLVLSPGLVSTDMNDHKGILTTEESASGIITVLESGQPLNGRFMSYDGAEFPW